MNLDRTKITKSETVKISVKLAPADIDFATVQPKIISFNIAYKKNDPVPESKPSPGSTVQQPIEAKTDDNTSATKE